MMGVVERRRKVMGTEQGTETDLIQVHTHTRTGSSPGKQWRGAQVGYVLVVEHNVGQPNMFRGHIQLCHASVFRGIPDEFIVLPFLQRQQQRVCG